MNETYTMVGTSPSWVVALMPVPALVTWSIMSRRKKIGPGFGWWEPAIAGCFLIAALADVPTEWIIGGAVLSASIVSLCGFRKLKFAPTARAGFGALFLGLAVAFAAIGMHGDVITLTQTSLRYSGILGDGTIPRSSLIVKMEAPDKMWFDIRPWSSWDALSAGKRVEHVAGFFLYWGPHGLVRGDNLGRRIANWARVVSVKPPPIFTERTGVIGRDAARTF